MREWLARLRDFLRRDRLDAELKEELQFHQAQLDRDASPRRLGNVTLVREDAREIWSIPWLDQFQQDVRYALRGIRRSPGFAATVILTLGLGIGANAAMFGIIDRLMFRPYEYMRQPGSVHRVYLQTTGQRTNTYVSFPYRRYLDLKQWTTSFSHYAAVVSARHAVGIGEGARVQPVVGVSASFFDFFDARPVMGRFIGPADDSLPAGSNVVVVGYAFWKTELGGRDVLGEQLQVGNVSYTIIGIAPEGFVGIAQTRDPAVFLPVTAYAANEGGGSKTNYYTRYNWDWAEMMVRRKPGVNLEAAATDLTNAFIRSRVAARAVHPQYAQVERANPRAIPGSLKTAAGPQAGLESRTLLWVTGVAVIVLLIACANVANLYLARAFRRRREFALRLALGVTRRRLVAQSLTESLLLSMIGCALGILIAQVGGAGLRNLFLPFNSSLDFLTDWRTLGVATGAGLFAAVATGLVPVLLAGRRDVMGSLKAGVREGTHQRSHVRSALLIAQGALSVVLLVGAALFVRSLANAHSIPLGYDPKPVLIMFWERRGLVLSDAERAQVRLRVLESARATPGVEGAAWVNSVPGQGTTTMTLSVPGIDSVPRLGRFNYQPVSPGYFEVLGTRIIRGRPFTEGDRAGAPLVGVVSEGMARVLWPDKDALGQCLKVNGWAAPADTMPCITVVGVAENVLQSLEGDEPLRYYVPMEQSFGGGSQLLLRMRGDPVAAAEGVRRAIQSSLPGMSFLFVQPMQDLYERQRRSWRMGATMFVAFGVLALVVAAIGLYGVIAYSVAQRTHEMGVRVALGAQARDIITLVVGQGVSFALAGVAIGLGLAVLTARFIQPLLFQQPARDPVVYGVVGALLILVALVASLMPALRATAADPNAALRAE